MSIISKKYIILYTNFFCYHQGHLKERLQNPLVHYKLMTCKPSANDTTKVKFKLALFTSWTNNKKVYYRYLTDHQNDTARNKLLMY